MKRKNGFTVIELLIVLAILAILGAIAIPIYRNYMSGGAISEAKSNLQTLSLLLESYSAENGRYAPSAGTYVWENNGSGTIITNDFCSGAGCTGGSNWLPSFQPKKAAGGAVANYRYTLTVATITTTADSFTATAEPQRGPVQGSGNLTINHQGTKTGW